MTGIKTLQRKLRFTPDRKEEKGRKYIKEDCADSYSLKSY